MVDDLPCSSFGGLVNLVIILEMADAGLYKQPNKLLTLDGT